MWFSVHKKLILLWICLDLICTSRPDFTSTYYVWQLHYTTTFFLITSKGLQHVNSIAQTVSKTEVCKT